MEKDNKGSEPIKTALEKAMEKVEHMEAPSEEELLEWKWVPKGKQMAAQYLQGACELPEVISNTEETGRNQFVKGIIETLLENIRLPRSEQEYKTNELAMEGLKSIKNDKDSMEELISRVQYVCTQYAQHGLKEKEEKYNSMKQEFQTRIEEIRSKQPSNVARQIETESLSQFQSEWLRISNQFDEQYLEHLQNFRTQVRLIR